MFDKGAGMSRIRSTPTGLSSLRIEKTNCVGALEIRVLEKECSKDASLD